MKIAVISDIHDHIWNLNSVLNYIERETSALIICGDFCSPFILKHIATRYSHPIHAVFGNNDGDRFHMSEIGREYPGVHLHGECFIGQIGSTSLFVNHYPEIATEVAISNKFDVVCYGHNHLFHIGKKEKTLLLNPGSVMGYSPRLAKEMVSTFIILDTVKTEPGGYCLSGKTIAAESVIESYPSSKHE